MTHREIGSATRERPGIVVRDPRGRERRCRSWLTEAAFRMLQNNLDPEVAENPEALVVYGGIGRAARNWECFDAILATLERLRPWVEEATWIVPGHGSPIDAQRALAILREDAAYLAGLPDPETPIPLARRTGAQRKIHEENLTRVAR